MVFVLLMAYLHKSSKERLLSANGSPHAYVRVMSRVIKRPPFERCLKSNNPATTSRRTSFDANFDDRRVLNHQLTDFERRPDREGPPLPHTSGRASLDSADDAQYCHKSAAGGRGAARSVWRRSFLARPQLRRRSGASRAPMFVAQTTQHVRLAGSSSEQCRRPAGP